LTKTTASWHAFTFHNEFQGATNIHCDEVLTLGSPTALTQLRVRKSALLRAALDRSLHLPIEKKDFVRFRAHECNSRADDHGDGEHIESIPHEENGRQGVQS